MLEHVYLGHSVRLLNIHLAPMLRMQIKAGSIGFIWFLKISNLFQV